MMIRSQAHEGQRGAGWRAAGGQVVVFKQHAVVAAVQTRHLGHGRKTTIARTCKLLGKFNKNEKNLKMTDKNVFEKIN